MIVYPLAKATQYPLTHPIFQTYKQLNAYFPNLMLAGSGLRDLILNKPTKDFGFFYFHGEEKLNTSYLFDAIVPEVLNGEYYHRQLEDFALLSRHQALQFQDELENVFEFIYTGSTFLDTIKGFQLSINQIWYDGTEIKISDHFLKTYQTREVILFEKDYLSSAAFVRGLEKMQAKFPEFDFTKILQKKPKAKKSERFITSSVYDKLVFDLGIQAIQPVAINPVPQHDPEE